MLLTAISHYSIYYGGLIRGYETSSITAFRNVGLLTLLAILPIFLKRFVKFQGNWTLYTSAVLLFSIGLTVQYRLFSDPEYISRKDKAAARQEKIKSLQLHYIQENYSAEKKQIMGLPPTPPSPVDLSAETPRPSEEDLTAVLLSGKTVNPLLGILGMIAALLLNSSTTRIVQTDHRSPGLHRKVHYLTNLLGVRLGQRSAKYGEVLGEYKYLASIHEPVPGNDTVAEDLLILHPEIRRSVDDELIKLFETAIVEEELDPLASGHFSARLLFCNSLGPAAKFGLARLFFQKLDLAHRTSFRFHKVPVRRHVILA